MTDRAELSADDITRNLVTYQFGWFMCVLCAMRDVAWAGILIAALLMAVQLLNGSRPAREAAVIVSVALIGGLWETALVWGHLISYPSHGAASIVAPPWMFMLWGLFASTLNVSMRWLQGRPVLAAFVGSVSGPLAYAGGERIGALTMPNPTGAYLALAVGWAVLTPALLALARMIAAADRSA